MNEEQAIGLLLAFAFLVGMLSSERRDRIG